VCGICGTTRAGDGTALRRMNAAMIHRGPDDEGIYLDPESRVGLGARRLSIIDVAGGHQPLCNEDRSIWAVLNGEIYNHGNLRERLLLKGHSFTTKSDTEVLVHLYEEYGDSLVHALEGMYAFALWDARNDRLLIARDRFGEKPLFYRQHSGDLTFASELTALCAGLDCKPDVDPQAIDEFFILGYLMGPATILQGIQQLGPGETLCWARDGHKLALSQYWEPTLLPSLDTASLQELVTEVERALELSVGSRLIADVPVGIFLSGGVDSTLVAALAARHSSMPIKTFTVGYDAGEVDERGAARRAAAAIDAEHHEVVITSVDIASRVERVLRGIDQPLADQALVPSQAVAELARREVTVAVGGEGADELFGGYPRYRWLARAEKLQGATPRLVLSTASGVLDRLRLRGRGGHLHHLLEPLPLLDRHLGWVAGQRLRMRENVYGRRLQPYSASRTVHTLLGTAMPREVQDARHAFMHLDQITWLPGDVLAKADRASMAVSLEVRTPYLSRQVAELAMSIPSGLHARGGGKYLLRSVLRRVLPTAPRPPKVAFRAPTADWLRGPLSPLLRRQLDSGSVFREGWLDAASVGEMAYQHETATYDWSDILWPVLALGLWLDRFRDLEVG
jgi:asparagine synthase (glutamine-hydrolysing)